MSAPHGHIYNNEHCDCRRCDARRAKGLHPITGLPVHPKRYEVLRALDQLLADDEIDGSMHECAKAFLITKANRDTRFVAPTAADCARIVVQLACDPPT